jgi:carbamoyl-phosphate synthase small subunit
MNSYLVLEGGQVFSGVAMNSIEKAGEVVFNTSHSGYEEIATDPSYYSQIMVMTMPMQGNYGADKEVWESGQFYIHGFICLEMQKSQRDSSWVKKLTEQGVPILTEVDTRTLVIELREKGTTWGAVVHAENEKAAVQRANELISHQKKIDKDWPYAVARKQAEDISGDLETGPKVAVLDFGCKQNILRELKKRCSAIRVFPPRTDADAIRQWGPDGIMLSNGPGDPENVEVAVNTVKDLLGWRFIFGICMGHQILSRALGAKTYRLKFGHRGSNHPIKDDLLQKIYVTSQNHGYAVEKQSLPKGVTVTHTNLNDMTVSGIQCPEKKCLSVQFHPESHPGPHDAVELFDLFVKQTR